MHSLIGVRSKVSRPALRGVQGRASAVRTLSTAKLAASAGQGSDLVVHLEESQDGRMQQGCEREEQVGPETCFSKLLFRATLSFRYCQESCPLLTTLSSGGEMLLKSQEEKGKISMWVLVP